MLGRSLIAFLLAFAALTAPAGASVVGGATDDPLGDSSAGPGTDMIRAAWLFDSEAGRWTVSVTFAARPTDADYGIVNAQILDATAPGCGGAPFGVFRGTARTGSASAGAGSSADGVQPDGTTGPSYAIATNVKSDDGRTTTLDVSHPRLVGRTAACVTFTISNHGVKDSAAVPAPGVPVTPAQPAAPGTPYAIPPTTRVDLRLTSSRTLRFRKGAARLTFANAAAGMTSRLSLWVGKRRIAQGRFTAGAPVAVRTRLFLTRAGAAYLRRHRAGKAKLVVRTTLDGRTLEQHFRVRVKRWFR